MNERGHLVFGGCDVTELAERYGTPLFLLDESYVRARCRAYLEAFRRRRLDFRVLYAGKAFLTTAMCRIVESEGLSLDVVSGGELATAMAADFPPDRIWFHGNNKSAAEIEMGLAAGIGRFVVDSGDEIERLDEIARARGKVAEVQIRVTPGIKPSTHSYIQTGQIDSKFGFSVGNGLALDAVRAVLGRDALRLRGIHCHIGSQIHEIASFAAEVGALVDFLVEVKAATAWVAEELNVGGGLGIAYLPHEQPPPIDAYVHLLVSSIEAQWPRLDAPPPTVMVEPGRSIVGEAGITVYRIDTVKEIPGVRTYASVDGGMTDNLRVALYQARYHGVLANRMGDPGEGKVSIAGKCCETGDMIAWDLDLPRVRKGDLLAVFSTGAYHYSMASNYNRLPRPPVILVREGEACTMVRRETYADVLAHDEIPEHLRKARSG
jgi:diaminopimelate decarboxylase